MCLCVCEAGLWVFGGLHAPSLLHWSQKLGSEVHHPSRLALPCDVVLKCQLLCQLSQTSGTRTVQARAEAWFVRNYLEAIRRKETEVLGQRAEAAGCRLAAVAPRWPPGRAGRRAGALLLSLHPCACMLLRISCDFFLSFLSCFFFSLSSFLLVFLSSSLLPSLLSLSFLPRSAFVQPHFSVVPWPGPVDTVKRQCSPGATSGGSEMPSQGAKACSAVGSP